MQTDKRMLWSRPKTPIRKKKGKGMWGRRDGGKGGVGGEVSPETCEIKHIWYSVKPCIESNNI